MERLCLYTERLVLRYLQASDLEPVHELHSLPETDRFNTLGIPQTLEETKTVMDSWINEYHRKVITNYTFVIEQRKSKQFTGLIALKLGKPKFKTGEVWYKLHRSWWGRGYATESLNRILDFAFTALKLHRIEAGCAVENIASMRVLEKVGMIKEGRKRKVLPLVSGWSDNFEYAILDTDTRIRTHPLPPKLNSE